MDAEFLGITYYSLLNRRERIETCQMVLPATNAIITPSLIGGRELKLMEIKERLEMLALLPP